jgi:hypothetical protein
MNEHTITNFFVNGYIHGHIDEIVSIDFDKYTFIDCNNENCENMVFDASLTPLLNKFYKILEDRFVSKIFNSYTLYQLNAWKGVDSYSSEWHNDFTSTSNFNSNILIYLDDSYDKNTIEVRNAFEEFVIYPKKGDFVWLNQNPKFEHRARHVEGIRRLISFEMYINDLWT